MSAELKIIDPCVLSETERTELDTTIDSLIAAHKNNRQEINRLVFESVSAMTMGEDYERQLANKKGLRRFLGGITGSNKRLQDKINSRRAAVQYASQQTLQRLAEQNLMSFDLITAVNNKLNASVATVEGEINQIYAALVKFFKQSRSDVMQLENRLERLERNVNLLNWQNSIEYQMLNGVEYSELDDTAKIVCLVRDFYDITKGEWTTADLLLLKTAMSTIGILPRETIDYFGFINAVAYDGQLSEYLLGGKQMVQLPEPYMAPLLGIKKLELLDGEERFLVDAVMETLSEHGVESGRESLCGNLTRRYLKQESQINTEVQINHYDLMIELLFDLQMAEGSDILTLPGDDVHIDLEDEAIKLEKDFQKAARLFKNCQLKEAHPLLTELSEKGYARANALLYWLLLDGYEGLPSNVEVSHEYATKGYQAGDVICTLQYALFCIEIQDERVNLCAKYKPLLQELAEAGDVFAIYMLGICYLNQTDEPRDHTKALKLLIDAARQNFYRAFYGIALRYYNGDGVEKSLENALLWLQEAMSFPQFLKVIEVTADILYDSEKYEEAFELYMKYIEKGGESPFNRVGYMYDNGRGVSQDYSKALEYYLKAGDSGYGGGYTNAGYMYDKGRGVPTDLQKAAECFMKAAELGNDTGQCNLAYYYLNGRGVPHDREKAKYWLEKSAAQGYQRAIDMLYQYFG